MHLETEMLANERCRSSQHGAPMTPYGPWDRDAAPKWGQDGPLRLPILLRVVLIFAVVLAVTAGALWSSESRGIRPTQTNDNSNIVHGPLANGKPSTGVDDTWG